MAKKKPELIMTIPVGGPFNKVYAIAIIAGRNYGA